MGIAVIINVVATATHSNESWDWGLFVEIKQHQR